MSKNAIIIGAGPGISNSLAEKFGQAGYKVGLISRNATKLEGQVADLKNKGVTAHYATADAYKKEELTSAIENLRTELGSIDTLIYNAAALKMKKIMDETPEDLVEDFKISTVNAFHAVQTLHADLKENQGSVLLTGGVFGVKPNVRFGSLSLGKASLRNLALQLNKSLRSDKVFVCTLTVNGYIKADSPTHSPAILADKFWELHQNRKDAELQY